VSGLKLRMPLASRITLTFSFLLLGVFSIVAIVAEHHLVSITREQAELRAAELARSIATMAAPGLMSYDYVTLQQIAEDSRQEPGIIEVTILDKEGLIAGKSGHREVVGRPATDPVCLRGLVAPEPFSVQGADVGGGPMTQRLQPVLGPAGTRWGTVRLGLSLRPVQQYAWETRSIILVFAGLGLLFTLAASHLLARRITRPLGLLIRQADGLGRGEWNHDVRIETGDEIEKLADQFAQAATSLDHRNREIIRAHDELAALNATLEEKVRERTNELVESREKYRLLVEASPDPLCLVQRGRFCFANRAFLETFGYNNDQVLAETFSLDRILHPDFARVAAEVIAQAEANGEPIDSDWVAVGRGGRSLDYTIRGRVVAYKDGPAVELLWLDLTEKNRILRQMVQNERLRAIGEMTAMVAHNFNNLLAVILGRAQLLQSRTKEAAIMKGLEVIRTAATQGGEIVKRIQEFSGETTEMQFREVNAAAVMREVVAYLDRLWRVTRTPGVVPVTIDLTAESVPPVLGSEALLVEVFKHIVTNAAEAMPGGGTIRITVTREDGMVRVWVEDSGIGMTPEVRRRAFDPFFTTKGSRARGLGLSASYGVVQKHRGRIELKSLDEGGTAVEILLPMHHSVVAADPCGPTAQVVLLSEEQEAARRLMLKLRERAPSVPEDERAA
jgi:PAS domain S-box-containing protein